MLIQRTQNNVFYPIRSILNNIGEITLQLDVKNRMDSETLHSAQKLDPHALTNVHDELYPIVYRYVRYRLDNEQVCEDITSEVFLRFLTAINQQKKNINNINAWMLGTASHLIYDYLRAHYQRPTDELNDDLLVSPHRPEEEVEDAWQQREIRSAMQKLTVDQQQVLALRFSEERSLEETAQALDKSIGAVKILQFRALAALRKLLTGHSKRGKSGHSDTSSG
jgi:RNA polymerase sigma-70 factor (ECF subfamily)